MVKRLIVKLLIELGTTFGKSFIKAYQQTAKQQRTPNQFTDFINQTMQAANLTHKPMTLQEAYKILNIEPEKADAEIVIKTFWRQFHKNDPNKGGSFYVQSVILNAKQEIMKNFPDAIEEDIITKLKAEQKIEAEEEAQEKLDKESK